MVAGRLRSVLAERIIFRFQQTLAGQGYKQPQAMAQAALMAQLAGLDSREPAKQMAIRELMGQTEMMGRLDHQFLYTAF